MVGLGHEVRCLVRRTSDLQPIARLPVEVWAGDVTDPRSLAGGLDGVDAVVHLVGIIREQRPSVTFQRVHVEGTANLLAGSGAAGAGRFLFMSAIGADAAARYPYLATKGRAEQLVKAGGIPWTIIRSSIVYGAGDEFMSQLAALVRRPPVGDRLLAPFVPIIGSGKTRFQLIHVDDVARCVALAATEPQFAGEVITVGGPEEFTYEQLVDLVMGATGIRRPKLHLPVALMRPAVKLLPLIYRKPPITSGQLDMIGLDSVCDLDSVERRFGFAPARLRDRLGYLKDLP